MTKIIMALLASISFFGFVSNADQYYCGQGNPKINDRVHTPEPNGFEAIVIEILGEEDLLGDERMALVKPLETSQSTYTFKMWSLTPSNLCSQGSSRAFMGKPADGYCQRHGGWSGAHLFWCGECKTGKTASLDMCWDRIDQGNLRRCIACGIIP